MPLGEISQPANHSPSLSELAMLYVYFGSSRTTPISNKPLLSDIKDIALQIGIPTPNIFYIRSRRPQALASAEQNAIYISSAVLDYPPDELKAIIAHEMKHLKQYAERDAGRSKSKGNFVKNERDADKAAVCTVGTEAVTRALAHLKADWIHYIASPEYKESYMEQKLDWLASKLSSHDSINTRISNAKAVKPSDCKLR